MTKRENRGVLSCSKSSPRQVKLTLDTRQPLSGLKDNRDKNKASVSVALQPWNYQQNKIMVSNARYYVLLQTAQITCR